MYSLYWKLWKSKKSNISWNEASSFPWNVLHAWRLWRRNTFPRKIKRTNGQKIKSKITTQLLQIHCVHNSNVFTTEVLNKISTISPNVRRFIPHVKTFDVFSYQPIYKMKYVWLHSRFNFNFLEVRDRAKRGVQAFLVISTDNRNYLLRRSIQNAITIINSTDLLM